MEAIHLLRSQFMSKAFTKESDEIGEVLPDRPISSARNLVTAEGLSLIETTLSRLGEEQKAAEEAGDAAALARIVRDRRYWSARRATAELVPPPSDAEEVRFGSMVTVVRPDGSRRTWRIVGEDEADPGRGTLSHASPVARALMGGQVGDEVEAGGLTLEIVEIS